MANEMWVLTRAKVKSWGELGSRPVISRRRLHSSMPAALGCLPRRERGVQANGHQGLDSIGAFVIGALCFGEGKEAFEKAWAGSYACTSDGILTMK
jgi:hypothetical protein